jgi:predicted RNA-binding Zn ribbon-like protein
VAARDPAPGALQIVQKFVNTADIESATDELSEPAALRTWLMGHDLIGRGERCTAGDIQRATAVREAVRALLLGHAGEETSDDARGVLDGAALRARFTVRFEGDQARLEPTAPGVDGAIGHLLAIVTASMADGTWARLKACRSDSCQWAFYDHSRNGSGAWCDMAICGSREKMRTYRRRRRSPATR